MMKIKPKIKLEIKPKFIAFYLPAYHPIPENDKAWGKGFTEWDNVRSVKYPKMPLLGYYDLTNPEIRASHVKMAQDYGVYGFCYYHFWLNGKPIFSTPLDEVLKSSDNHPFCFCWANENWTRRWDGLEKQVIQKQTYTDDPEVHWAYLERFFKDKRYIRINDKPVFLIYLPKNMPKERLKFYKDKGVYLIGCMHSHDKHLDYKSVEVDGVYEFSPHNFPPNLLSRNSFSPEEDKEDNPSPLPTRIDRSLLPITDRSDLDIEDICRNIRESIKKHDDSSPRKKRKRNNSPSYNSRHPTYDLLIEKSSNCTKIHDVQFPGVCVGWDNSPRCKGLRKATKFIGSNPDKFEVFLRSKMNNLPGLPEPFLFINAWNEWGEGAFLEPDIINKYAYLEKIKGLTNE